MLYIKFWFYIFVLALLLVYYALPLKHRWVALLLGSVAFYVCVQPDVVPLLVFLFSILSAYLGGIFLGKIPAEQKGRRRLLLAVHILLAALPLLLVKSVEMVCSTLALGTAAWLVVPLGLSFYTMSLISYLADIYQGKIQPQKDPFRFLLFASFFPLIIQGPIHRYDQLASQLYEGHRFDSRSIGRGFQLILWGFFLKLMIADKAGLLVDTVYGDPASYAGAYFWLAAVLYSIQLYTDFMACVDISRGVCWLFGIQSVNNFRQPYLADSVSDFWRRWHISLSSWLRDYIYIPLGGRNRRYLNLVITFLVSGLWHGSSVRFLCWGLLNGIYLIVGRLTASPRQDLSEKLGFAPGSSAQKFFKSLGVFFLITLSWVIFRADSLQSAFHILLSMFTTPNFYVLCTDEIFALGLSIKECMVLLLSILLLVTVSLKQEKQDLGEWLLKQPAVLRFGAYYGMILVIWIFGTYGFGFNAQDFIYGGF